MYDSTEIVQFINTHPLFSALDAVDKSIALANISIKKYKPGEVIFSQDTRKVRTYFVLSGEVQTIDSNNKKKIVESGQFLGYAETLTEQSHSITAISHLDTKILVIPKSYVQILQHKYPDVLSHFLRDNPLEKVADTTKLDQPKWWDIIGYLSILIVAILTYNLLGGLSEKPEITLFITALSATITMWFFRLMPAYLPALFFLLSILAMGLVPPDVILRGFATQTFIILMSTFIIGSAILLTGLGHRLMLLFFNRFSNSFLKANMALFFSGAFLTPLIPSVISRVQIAAPIYLEAIQALGFKERSVGANFLAVSLFFGATLFSSVVLSGTLFNYMVLALLPEYMQIHFSWLIWLKGASVYGLVLVLGYLMTNSYFTLKRAKINPNKKRIQEQINILGKPSLNEKITAIAVLIFLAGILTVQVHKIEIAWIAFFVMTLILFFQVISTKQFSAQIDLPFLIVITTTIGISHTMRYLHVDLYLFNMFSGLMNNYVLNGIEYIGFTAALTFLLRIILPIGPAMIVAGTLTIPLASHYHINPWVIAFVVLIVSDIWFLKHQSPMYSVFKNHSKVKGKVFYDESKFLKFNYIMNVIKVIGLAASIPLWKYMGMI